MSSCIFCLRLPSKPEIIAESKEVNMAAHRALMEIAMQEYSGMIDIADIVWVYSKRSGGNPLFMKATYTATGKVVSLDGSNGKTAATGVEGALARRQKKCSKVYLQDQG